MKIEIIYDEKELKNLIISDIMRKLDLTDFDEKLLNIEVKTSENYRAEKKWEKGLFRASYSHYKA